MELRTIDSGFQSKRTTGYLMACPLQDVVIYSFACYGAIQILHGTDFVLERTYSPTQLISRIQRSKVLYKPIDSLPMLVLECSLEDKR